MIIEHLKSELSKTVEEYQKEYQKLIELKVERQKFVDSIPVLVKVSQAKLDYYLETDREFAEKIRKQQQVVEAVERRRDRPIMLHEILDIVEELERRRVG